jgi:hypothetical protein
VIDPEGGAWSEGAAGVDVLVMSSSSSPTPTMTNPDQGKAAVEGEIASR